MGSLLGGAAPMLCGSGVLPLHMAAAGQGTPLKLAAATAGRLLRSVGCSSGGSAASSGGRQSGSNPSGALSWQPARWRSIISRAGTSGVLGHLCTGGLSSLTADCSQLRQSSIAGSADVAVTGRHTYNNRIHSLDRGEQSARGEQCAPLTLHLYYGVLPQARRAVSPAARAA